MKIKDRCFAISRIILIFILILISSEMIFAQKDRVKLEQEKKKIEEEIQYTNHLLS